MGKCDLEMQMKVCPLPMLLLVVVYDVLLAKEENGSFEQEEQVNALREGNVVMELDYLQDWPRFLQLPDVARPLQLWLLQLKDYVLLRDGIVVPIKV